jgi:hypothetical protein
VDGFEDLTDVLGGTTWFGVNLETVLFSGIVKFGLSICGGQRLEEFLDGSGDAIVNLVAGGPEGVWL